MVTGVTATRPQDITDAVVESFAGCENPRLKTLLQSLTRHLHAFAVEVGLTEDEWRSAIDIATRTGHITDERRQEFILWSDELGLSMLVDALSNSLAPGATESTILGPFYAAGSPVREYGAVLSERPAGTPCLIHGRVLSTDGQPIAGAELDVWQNGDDRMYAVQDPEAPKDHLRGRFHTREDGSFAFVGVRPLPYTIPFDGPAGEMLIASGRHPWRPAHVHVIVRAAGYRTVTTHIFDSASEYIDSDAVFATKPSLLRDFVERPANDPQIPAGVSGAWCSVHTDFVLAPGDAAEPTDPGRTA